MQQRGNSCALSDGHSAACAGGQWGAPTMAPKKRFSLGLELGERGAPTMAPALPGAGCPRSLATRSATETAAMRRGCVQIRLARAPRPPSMAASSRNCGTCGAAHSKGQPDNGHGGDKARYQVACWGMRAGKNAFLRLADLRHLR